MRKCLLAVLAVPFLCASVASANHTVTETGAITSQTTDWDLTLGFAKAPAVDLGEYLNSITITLGGAVSGNAAVENLDASSKTITTKLRAVLTLMKPDYSTLVVTIPTAQTSQLFASFDGTDDKGGTSGVTYGGLTNSASNTVVLTGGAMSAFVGGGSITLPVFAEASSTASGGGNISSIFHTNASADVMVEYNYIAVPEPASLGLLGLAGLSLLARRRK